MVMQYFICIYLELLPGAFIRCDIKCEVRNRHNDFDIYQYCHNDDATLQAK